MEGEREGEREEERERNNCNNYSKTTVTGRQMEKQRDAWLE